MRIFYTVILALLVFLSGCSSYMLQSQKESIITDTVSKSVFTVTFCGNAYMSQKQAEKYVMQRACELTLTKGFTHFVVLQKSNQSEICSLTDAPRPTNYTPTPSTQMQQSESFASPESLVRPNITLRIQCYNLKDAPNNAIDAQAYLNENFPGLKFHTQ